MSLATFAKKSRTQRSVQSRNGFSTSGVYRTQGWVGQTSISRHISRTPFRGPAPMGHGGTLGNYKIHILCTPTECTDDRTTIKGANLGHSSRINAMYHYPVTRKAGDAEITCPGANKDATLGQTHFNWVMPQSTLSLTASEHTRNQHIQASTCNTWGPHHTQIGGGGGCSPGNDCKSTYMLGTRRISRQHFYNKANPSGSGSGGKVPYTQSSEYITARLLKRHCLPTPKTKDHFPRWSNMHGCMQTFTTPEEAITAGMLPQGWMGITTTPSPTPTPDPTPPGSPG